jgi:hypothetical protein
MVKQKPIKGQKRLRLSSSVEKAIRKAVEADAELFGVSMSFVQNTALAEIYGIEVEKYYLVGQEGPRQVKRRKVRNNIVKFRRRA